MRKLFVALVVAGCSSGGGNGGISDPASFQQQAAVASCQQAARCGFIGASEEKKCEMDAATTAKMYPSAYSIADAVKQKRLTFDAKAAQACVEAQKNAGCSVDAYFDALDKCAPTYKGAVPTGGTCLSSFECATGNWCDQGNGTGTDGCSGTCKANDAAGATCDPNNPHCNDSDYCDGTTMKCTARAQVGQPCGQVECAIGSTCKGYIPADDTTTPPTPETPGTCSGRGKLGDPCQTYFFGDTDCQVGLFCDPNQQNPVCSQPLAMGSDCSWYYACQDPLDCTGLTFDQNTGAVAQTGKCSPFLDIGQTCSNATADDTGCPLDSTCDTTSMTCKLGGQLGDTCDPMGFGGCSGANLYCDGATSKCTQMVPFGGACTPPMTDSSGFPIGDDPCHDGSCDATSMVCAIQCM